MDKIGLS